MKKRYSWFYSGIFFAFLVVACLASEAQAGATTATGQDCILNTTCGAAATRGNGMTPTTSGCTPGAGEYCGAQAQPGFNTAPVYAWNLCRYITNNMLVPIFVPFGNQNDWLAFINNAPSSNVASLGFCSTPATFTIYPDRTCTSPNFTPSSFALTPVVSLGYALWTLQSPPTQTNVAEYTCTTSSGQTWQEYESVTYTGLNSDDHNPSWIAGTPVCSLVAPGKPGYPQTCAAPSDQPASPTVVLTASSNNIIAGSAVTLTWTVTNATSCTAASNDAEADWTGAKAYLGTTSQTVEPALSPATVYALSCTGAGGTTQASVSVGVTIVGQCGPANNVAVNTAPTTGLCKAGQASAVSGTGPWTWTCAGSTVATTASCSAPAVGNMNWGTCVLSSPVLGTFSSSQPYAISGQGNSYSLVGSNGIVDMSGTQHGVNISGNGDTVVVSGGNNCIAVSGDNETMTVSGYTQTVNISGGSSALTFSGANDNFTINLVNGGSVALTISGVSNAITINGGNYTITSASGSGNTINGTPID